MSLELIFSSEREKVTSKKDAVICATHSAMLSAGLKCVGCGEQLVVTEETRGSDMMPNGWNSGSGVYVIHYRNESSKEKVYMLRALAVDNSLFIQLMRTVDGTFSDVNVNVENFVSDNLNEFNKAYTDVDGLMNTLRTQLINPVLTCPLASSSSSSASSSTRSSDRVSTGGGVISDHGHCGDPLMGNRGGILNRNAPRIGNRDLDPLGRGHAGMMFDPLRTGGGMPGMFGPPGTGRGLSLSIASNSQDDEKDFFDDEISDQPLDLTMNKTKADGSGALVVQLQAPTENIDSVATSTGVINVAGASSSGQMMQNEDVNKRKISAESNEADEDNEPAAKEPRVDTNIPADLLQKLHDNVRAVDVEFAGNKMVDVAVLDGAGTVLLRLYSRRPPGVSDGDWNFCKHRGLEKDLLEPQIIRKRVQTVLEGKLIVAHGAVRDLNAVGLSFPTSVIRDTHASLSRLATCGYFKFPSFHLDDLLAEYGHIIQTTVHCPVQDAMASLFLYLVNKDAIDWVSTQWSSGLSLPKTLPAPLLRPACADSKLKKICSVM